MGSGRSGQVLAIFWFLCSPLFFLASEVYGQARNAHWVLGGFLQTQPGSLWGEMTTAPVFTGGTTFGQCESAAAISDTSGTLLFYTGRGRVHRANGEEMYNSFSAWQNATVTQGQLIIPRPGHPELYDLIMIDSAADSTLNSLNKPKAVRMVVDMSADGGTGAVVGNELIFGYNLTERLCGTPHTNGSDYWILMHEWKSDKFLAYAIGEGGLDTLPVVSQTGAVHSAEYGTCTTNSNRQGEMKLTYSGDRVALCSFNFCGFDMVQPGIVQLFDFDALTGQVDYWMTLPDHYHTYGIEFSQTGGKFYVSGIDEQERYVDQYDLLAGDTTAIRSSRSRIYATPYNGQPDQPFPNAMELASNGRIYVSHSGLSLDVINAPDEQGLACGYAEASMVFGNYQQHLSHVSQMKRYHDSEFMGVHTGLGTLPRPETLRPWPDPALDRCHLTLPGRNIRSLSLLDATGSLVRGVPCAPGQREARIERMDLGSGIYLVLAKDAHGVIVATGRVMFE